VWTVTHYSRAVKGLRRLRLIVIPSSFSYLSHDCMECMKTTTQLYPHHDHTY
jgi:hypothetical protein